MSDTTYEQMLLKLVESTKDLASIVGILSKANQDLIEANKSLTEANKSLTEANEYLTKSYNPDTQNDSRDSLFTDRGLSVNMGRTNYDEFNRM
jgi:uncharacterized protein HemY